MPDVAMTDARPALPNMNDIDSEPYEIDIRMLPGSFSSDGSCASFEIANEDHTLGNALRYIIMKNPEVEFCGYSMPHPSEAKMNLRIQTYGRVTATDALRKGLEDLMGLCDVVTEKFVEARERFGGK